VLKRWFIVSSAVFHKGHLEGPLNHFLRRFSQVRVFLCIRSQRKVFILGQNKESQTLLLHCITSTCSECSSCSLASLSVKLPLPFMPHLSLSFSVAFLIFLLFRWLSRSLILLFTSIELSVSWINQSLHSWSLLLWLQ